MARLFWVLGTLLVGVLFAGCSGASSRKAHVQLRFGVSGKALSQNAQALPKDRCYLVHVTGPRLEKLRPDEWMCGPEVGLGQVTPRAYAAGESVEVSVLVGNPRRFDIVGFKSPLGVDGNGKAICGDARLEILAGPPHSERVKLFVNNQEVSGGNPVLFYTGTAAITPGENVVNMQSVALVSASVTTGLTYGAPYERKSYPTPAPGCGGGGGTTDAPLMIFSGVGIPSGTPISDGASANLEAAVSGHVQLHDTNNPQTVGGISLFTGLLSILGF